MRNAESHDGGVGGVAAAVGRVEHQAGNGVTRFGRGCFIPAVGPGGRIDGDENSARRGAGVDDGRAASSRSSTGGEGRNQVVLRAAARRVGAGIEVIAEGGKADAIVV